MEGKRDPLAFPWEIQVHVKFENPWHRGLPMAGTS